MNNTALIRAAWILISAHYSDAPKLSRYLDDGLFSDGAGAPLAGVEPLFNGEAAAVRLEPLNQQVVYSSKVVVAFVLQ